MTNLQLLHPVFTFGRLVLARFGFGGSSELVVEVGDNADVDVGEGPLLRN